MPVKQIRHRHTGAVIAEVEGERGDNPFGPGLFLMGCSFYSQHLPEADLRGANLAGVNMEGCNLQRALLSGAQMYGANLRHAALSHAELQGAEMKAAYLAHATLGSADLRGANLEEAVFHSTLLSGTDFAGAVLCSTVFADCPTLHLARGLAEVRHAGPCSLDRNTLRACVPHLPDGFLRGVGYSDAEVQALRLLYGAVQAAP